MSDKINPNHYPSTKIGYIYKIVNPSGHVYIGQTHSPQNRIYRYKGLDCKNQKRLYHSLVKYGFESHTFSIIEIAPYKNILNREKYWVEIERSNASKYPENNGLNLTDGGIGVSGRKMSEAQKAMISNRHKGKKMSEEARAKISFAGIGRKHRQESKEKMSISQKGRVISQEAKDKIREKLIGRPNYKLRKPIKRISLTDNSVSIYESIMKAAIDTGNVGMSANISSACKGKFSQAYGYKWMYV